MLLELVGEDGASTMPVERCFDWESLALVELAVGDTEAAARYAGLAEEDAAQLGLAAARRARRRCARGRAARRRRGRRGGPGGRTSRQRPQLASARDSRQHSRAAWRGERSSAAGERAQAIAVLREAEQELDACGSVRVRDEMRRELRKLGARAEPRGPATAGESGVAALTKRELEIAGLVTDRMTNREIAAALFLSDKTVESHMRNIFHKLGVSSRVDVARAIERERRQGDGAAAAP